MKTKLVLMVLSGVMAGACYGAANDVDAKTEKQWLNYTLPLPHEIAIKRANTVAPSDISIKLAESAGDIGKNAVAQLKQYLKERTGAEPVGSKFEIIIGVLDRDGKVGGIKVDNAAKLKSLPNNDQAYLIQPVGDDKLLLAALKPKGIYYAVQTLRQLLGRQIGKDAVSVPLATIIDWPDMNERGVWNCGYATPGFIPWMASMKLNFTHCWPGLILKKDQPAECTKLPMALIKQARDCAFLLQPHLTHYDYFFRYDSDNLYPEMIGKGDGARNPCYSWGGDFAKCRCPCLATPVFKRLVTEWIESAAAQGAVEVSLWLSERYPCQCECAACLKDGRKQFQKETQASVDAIMAARKKYPDLQGRIFFTLGGGDKATQDTAECLALLPPEIKAEAVYGRNAALDKYAADGHWLATYEGPRIGPGYWTLRYEADSIKERAREYYDAKYSAFYSLSRITAPMEVSGNWEKGFGNYQYGALAEWTWNVKGRNLRQFAEAWATINNYSQPEQFAAWIEIMGPMESFVRNWTYSNIALWLKAADELKNKGATPQWVALLPPPEKMREMLAKCDQALPIAEKISDQSVLLETRYVRTLLQAMTQFRALHGLCLEKDMNNAEKIKALQANAGIFEASIKELDQLNNGLMNIPALDPKNGPEKSTARHAEWTKALMEKVGAAVSAPIKPQ